MSGQRRACARTPGAGVALAELGWAASALKVDLSAIRADRSEQGSEFARQPEREETRPAGHHPRPPSPAVGPAACSAG